MGSTKVDLVGAVKFTKVNVVGEEGCSEVDGAGGVGFTQVDVVGGVGSSSSPPPPSSSLFVVLFVFGVKKSTLGIIPWCFRQQVYVRKGPRKPAKTLTKKS